jgi:hypothetical protein
VAFWHHPTRTIEVATKKRTRLLLWTNDGSRLANYLGSMATTPICAFDYLQQPTMVNRSAFIIIQCIIKN